MNAIYYCTEKRCREYHVEKEGMLPREYREATGSFVRCSTCGSVSRLVRVNGLASGGLR